MATLELPLIFHNCKKFFQKGKKELENYISTSNCPHSLIHLKDFTFDGNTASGTNPLLLACQHGELDSVKHIVESWGANVSASAPFYSNPSQQGQPTIQEATPLFIAAFHGYDKIVEWINISWISSS